MKVRRKSDIKYIKNSRDPWWLRAESRYRELQRPMYRHHNKSKKGMEFKRKRRVKALTRFFAL